MNLLHASRLLIFILILNISSLSFSPLYLHYLQHLLSFSSNHSLPHKPAPKRERVSCLSILVYLFMYLEWLISIYHLWNLFFCQNSCYVLLTHCLSSAALLKSHILAYRRKSADLTKPHCDVIFFVFMSTLLATYRFAMPKIATFPKNIWAPHGL